MVDVFANSLLRARWRAGAVLQPMIALVGNWWAWRDLSALARPGRDHGRGFRILKKREADLQLMPSTFNTLRHLLYPGLHPNKVIRDGGFSSDSERTGQPIPTGYRLARKDRKRVDPQSS
jgi:hypothetical protein